MTGRSIKSYQIASRLPDLFSELPCFCGCQWINHSSLLNCFRTTHGAKCALCQEEAEVAERLYTAYRLNKLTASPDTPRSLDEAERLRKEEAESNKKIALQLVRLFWKRRAVGGCMSFRFSYQLSAISIQLSAFIGKRLGDVSPFTIFCSNQLNGTSQLFRLHNAVCRLGRSYDETQHYTYTKAMG